MKILNWTVWICTILIPLFLVMHFITKNKIYGALSGISLGILCVIALITAKKQDLCK